MAYWLIRTGWALTRWLIGSGVAVLSWRRFAVPRWLIGGSLAVTTWLIRDRFARARWLIWGSFAVVWTTLLLLPGHEIQRTGITDWFANMWILAAKIGHFLTYALFAFLTGWLCVPARYRCLPLFFLMAHAAITEFLQQYVEGRTGCLEDVLLNHAGILFGVIVGWKWWTDPK